MQMSTGISSTRLEKPLLLGNSKVSFGTDRVKDNTVVMGVEPSRSYLGKGSQSAGPMHEG